MPRKRRLKKAGEEALRTREERVPPRALDATNDPSLRPPSGEAWKLREEHRCGPDSFAQADARPSDDDSPQGDP
jgi:hypothetical protein